MKRLSVLIGCLFCVTSISTLSLHAQCTPEPAGLVAWWPGEDNVLDAAGSNNGDLSSSGASYANGLVGRAFFFDGTNGYASVPDAPALKPTNLTCEAWVWLNPSLPSGRGSEQIVFKKNTWSAWFEGYSLVKSTIGNGDGTSSDRFEFTVSRYGNQVILLSHTIAQRGVWYHVAATYDGNQSILYVNGVAEASTTPGFPLDYDTTPLFIGTSGTWPPYLSMFGGIIDEVSLYNRALSSNEIAAIYNAGSAGKCPPVFPPIITQQPGGLTVNAGEAALFSVTATGTDPLAYQWNFNGTKIAGATNATLQFLNVHSGQAGNYTITVTNSYGMTTSSVATLTVNAHDILIYNNTGLSDTTTAGHQNSSSYRGRMFFVPDSTNGIFINWGVLHGRKQYWIQPGYGYLRATILGPQSRVYTVLGQAGDYLDRTGHSQFWSFLYKGLNTRLAVTGGRQLSFPAVFDFNSTQIYPDAQTGDMILTKASSILVYSQHDTETANNSGKTLLDLMNDERNALEQQGYQSLQPISSPGSVLPNPMPLTLIPPIRTNPPVIPVIPIRSIPTNLPAMPVIPIPPASHN